MKRFSSRDVCRRLGMAVVAACGLVLLLAAPCFAAGFRITSPHAGQTIRPGEILHVRWGVTFDPRDGGPPHASEPVSISLTTMGPPPTAIRLRSSTLGGGGVNWRIPDRFRPGFYRVVLQHADFTGRSPVFRVVSGSSTGDPPPPPTGSGGHTDPPPPPPTDSGGHRDPPPPPTDRGVGPDLECRISNRRFSKVLGAGWTYRLRFHINACITGGGAPFAVSNVPCKWTVMYAPLGTSDWRHFRSDTETVRTVRNDRWTGASVDLNLGSRGKGRYRLILEIDPNNRLHDPNRANNTHSQYWSYD